MKSNTVGIGIFQVNMVYPIPIYKNENDKTPFDTISFRTQKNGKTKIISKIRLTPYTMSEGDSFEESKKYIRSGVSASQPQLRFIVIDTTDRSFRVITNAKDGESFIIKRDDGNVYYSTENEYQENRCTGCDEANRNSRWYIWETWERYLRRVEYITGKNLIIYDKPGGSKIFENKENAFLPFEVLDVRGDWIKIKKGTGRQFNFKDSINYDGWTKWKEDGRLAIQITEQTYE